MATQLLDQVLSGSQLAPSINDNGEAVRAAALFGRRRSQSNSLDWGYYGGPTPVGYVPHGKVTLAPNATNYIEAALTDYVPAVNTTGFTNGGTHIPIRIVVTDTNGPISDDSVLMLMYATTP